MNKAFVTVLILMSQFAAADMISVTCKNTKIADASSIQLSNSDDFGKSGYTGKQSSWSLTIGDREVEGAYVAVIGSDANVSGFVVRFKTAAVLKFALSSDEKAFVFELRDGHPVRETMSFCSVDTD